MPPSSSAFASGTAAPASSSAMTGTTCRTDRQARAQQAHPVARVKLSRTTERAREHKRHGMTSVSGSPLRSKSASEQPPSPPRRPRPSRPRRPRVAAPESHRVTVHCAFYCASAWLALAAAAGREGGGGAWGLLSCAPPGASACIAACARGLPARPCGARAAGGTRGGVIACRTSWTSTSSSTSNGMFIGRLPTPEQHQDAFRSVLGY